ncbi:hypothetical protein [Catenulispora rubra]|uniref:hypothetical protein n=1 Tax=Catenulispora rubra TaxID=280293 RepID=UPI001892400C|nr:hypothetical protein [Catenulispora rubra]
MLDNEVFTEAMRPEDWTHLAGNGAAARAKSVGLRRTRYAGIVGGTAAAVVGAAVIAGTLGLGLGGGSAASAASPAASGTPTKSGPVTMAEVFAQWKTCPDSQLTVANLGPTDPADLQQRWRDACHRYEGTLSALLPSYEVTPDMASISQPGGSNPDWRDYENPAYVVPAGYTPHMNPNLYRVVSSDGSITSVMIRASRYVDIKPISGEQVTLSNGLKATLGLGSTDFLKKGDKGYGIFILDGSKSFLMTASGSLVGTASTPTPNFDFKTLVMSPQFAQMVTQSLAEPES